MKEYKTEDEYEMIPLSESELKDALNDLSGWEQIDSQWIARQYKFNEYMDGITFAKEVGEYAEKRQHHPLINIAYKKVKLEMSSWRAKGVTAIDIEMVKDFNEIYNKYI